MLAVVGIIVQQLGIHVPGEAYTNKDIFGAVSSVGWGPNLQIFLGMAFIELTTFNMHYGEGEPGDFGLDGGMLKNMTPEQIKYRQESEIVYVDLRRFYLCIVLVLCWGLSLTSPIGSRSHPILVLITLLFYYIDFAYRSHGRLAMIAFTGAIVQTLLFGSVV
jgi:hypothetical protein